MHAIKISTFHPMQAVNSSEQMYESSLRHRHEILATCSVAITFSFYVLCGGDEGLLPVDIPLRVERLIDPAGPSVS